MSEAAVVLALLATGWWLVGGPPWRRLVLSLPVGIAAMVLVELVLLCTGLPIARPRAALVVTVLVAAVVAWRRGEDGGRPARSLVILGLGTVSGLIALTWAVPLVNVTADSFRYLSVAQFLAADGAAGEMHVLLLQKRGLATGALHALADIEPGYLRAVGPLVALSTVALLAMAVQEHVGGLDERLRRWLLLGAAALLVTNHRFLFSAFYINGHVLFAAWLLLVVVTVLGLRRGVVRGSRSVLPAALALAALVVTRPEGALVALVAVAPVVVDIDIPVATRRMLLLAIGATTAAWHGIVLGLQVRMEELEMSVPAMTGLGIVVIVLALGLPWLDRWLGRPWLHVAHGLAWALLFALTVREPGIMLDSIEATVENVVWDGRWGASLLVLATLLVVALVARRVRAEDAVVFPVFMFVPLMALLAYLRGAAYRDGPGDSLNRMIIHILPVAILLLALTADSEPREWPRRWLRALRRGAELS